MDFSGIVEHLIFFYTDTKMEKTKNQIHRISGNKDLRKIIFKNRSGSSMVMFKDIDYVNASVRVNALKNLYPDWRGKFIIIR